MNKLKQYGPWVIALTAIFSALWFWYHPNRVLVQGPGWVDVTNHSSKQPRVACQDNQIVVIPPGKPVEKNPEKPKVSENAQTAPQNAQEAILATGDVPASKTGFALKCTLLPLTGEAKIMASAKSRPLFGFENEKELGAVFSPIGFAGYGRWTFARIGNFYASGEVVAAYSQGRGVVVPGIGVSYRW